LEVWVGGSGPAALARVGRVADGWLGSALTPEEAGRAHRAIEMAAAGAGRFIDPEHFGLSIPYAATEPDSRTVGLLRSRRSSHTDDRAELSDLLPVGAAQLRELIKRHADFGLTKFVIRPLDRDASAAALADVLLPLQT
jgi:alkanesulfonate monooxygenase SsuD/methylene tetrahydromethanopterin reductase-like flavin-dependent oxidoreductase (luciferase family)